MDKYTDIEVRVKGLPEGCKKSLVNLITAVLWLWKLTDFAIETSEKTEEEIVAEVEDGKS